MQLKRFLSSFLSAVIAVGALTVGGSVVNANKIAGISAKEVRIATQPCPFNAPIFVAKEKGWLESELKKYNVKVKWTSFPAGPPMNQSFAAGQQDIGILGDVPAIVAKSSGQNNKIIANASYGPKTLALVVKTDSKIKSAKELKNQKIAYVKGSYGQHLLGLILDKAGLTFDDIQTVNLPVDQIANVVANGQVSAGVIWEPSITKAEEAGKVKVLIDGTGIKRCNVISVATEKFAKANPKIIEAYIKVYNKANKYIKSNPQDAAKTILPDIKLSKNELVKLFGKFEYSPALADVDIKELKVVEKFLRDQKITTKKVDIDKFVDTKYLKSAGIIK